MHRHRTPATLTAALVGAAALVAGLLGPAPAAHAAAGDPVILAPGYGQTVPSGFAGPSVDFTGVTPETYRVDLDCGNHGDGSWYADGTWYEVTGTETGPVTVPLDPVPNAGDAPLECDLVVADDATYGTNGWDITTFYIAPRPVEVTNLAASPETFYPLVRDRYRDTTTVSFKLTRPAAVAVRIRRTNGRVVRRVDLDRRRVGRHTWKWNGRDGGGDKLPAGSYRIQVSAADEHGGDDLAQLRVRIATKKLTKTKRLYKSGDRGRAATRGSCYVHWSTYDGTATPDCWGGTYAQVTYRFKLPKSARSIRWRARGERTSLDSCCRGTITKSGTRLGRRTFLVRVKVTQWRAWQVNAATVKYKYTKRI